MNAKNAISNLQIMSDELAKAANSPKNYNTEFSHYLETLSWEMHKHANELREIQYMLGGAS